MSCIPAKYTSKSCTAILVSYNPPIYLYITSHIEYGKKASYNNIICLFFFLFRKKEGQFGFKKEVDEKGCMRVIWFDMGLHEIVAIRYIKNISKLHHYSFAGLLRSSDISQI